MLKNFLLFAGHKSATRGGMSDFVDSFDSVYEAKAFMEKEETLSLLLDTLPAIQWMHIYDTVQKKIVVCGKVELWSKDEIGCEEDETTQIAWEQSENSLQPLFAQASEENKKRELAEAEMQAEQQEKEKKHQEDIDSLANVTVRVATFNLGKLDSAVDEAEALIEFSFNLVAMQQEGEVSPRHVRVMSLSFSDEDKEFLEHLGGASAVDHWIKKVTNHFTDEVTMEFFNNEVLTSDELESVTE